MADTYYEIYSGFYDSVNQDRLYSADDMNRPYKRIVTEGVFEADDGFAVTPSSGMVISIAAGVALLGERWVDAVATAITVPDNTGSYSRTDSVILQVNNTVEVRAARIVYRTGTPDGSGTAPSLLTDTDIYEFRIANITVTAGDSEITASQITDMRGTTDCPYATLLVGNTQLYATVEDVLEDHPEWTTTIQDSAVTTAKIAGGAVTTAKIADGAVTSAKIADGTIATADIADSAITSAKIADGTIATGDIADGAVTNAKVADNSITSGKLGSGVYNTKVGDTGDVLTFNEIAHSDTNPIAVTIGQTYDKDALDSKFTDVNNALETKAEIDGYYEEMTVGDAEQLVATQFVENEEPYLFRTTGGTADVGNRAYVDNIVGGTIAWNQLVPIPLSSITATQEGVTITDNRDGSYSVTTTAEGATNDVSFRIVDITGVKNHKIMYVGNDQNASLTTACLRDSWAGRDYSIDKAISVTANGFTVAIHVKSGAIITTPMVFKPQVFDITKAFNSTIADYIYTLEQGTAGAGVAWFKKYFPNDFYPFNAGELKHVSGVSSHDTVGFNQWDEEWESGSIRTADGVPVANASYIRSKNFCRCVPNTSYYFHSGNGSQVIVYYYDSNESYISYGAPTDTTAKLSTTPSNATYFKIRIQGATYKNDVCINLSWSGYRNGEYEPYEKHTYALDDSLTLRGIPKIDASGNLYYDGDTYAYDGTVTRRYGIVDLGTLTWTKDSSSGWFRTSGLDSVIARPSGTTIVADVACAKYVATTWADSSHDKIIAVKPTTLGGGTLVYIRDDTAWSGGDATAFKSSLSGVYLVYELATPTTETADAYQQVQIVDDFGTEEFVSTSIVPVGHETRYPSNLRDKLQHLPDLADDDGDYIIRQSNSQMSLVPYGDVSELPDVPTTTDGTYVLKATVSSGTATLAWVAE